MIRHGLVRMVAVSATVATQGFPPVTDAGHVYVNTGTELMCLTLPG